MIQPRLVNRQCISTIRDHAVIGKTEPLIAHTSLQVCSLRSIPKVTIERWFIMGVLFWHLAGGFPCYRTLIVSQSEITDPIINGRSTFSKRTANNSTNTGRLSVGGRLAGRQGENWFGIQYLLLANNIVFREYGIYALTWLIGTLGKLLLEAISTDISGNHGNGLLPLELLTHKTSVRT